MGSLMAVLAVIGGIDGRLRLGGQVIHEEYGEGTVTRITPKGRITVQFHETRTCRVCLLSQLKPVRASLLAMELSATHLVGGDLDRGHVLAHLRPLAAGGALQCDQPALHGAHAERLGTAGEPGGQQAGEAAYEEAPEPWPHRYCSGKPIGTRVGFSLVWLKPIGTRVGFSERATATGVS